MCERWVPCVVLEEETRRSGRARSQMPCSRAGSGIEELSSDAVVAVVAQSGVLADVASFTPGQGASRGGAGVAEQAAKTRWCPTWCRLAAVDEPVCGR